MLRKLGLLVALIVSLTGCGKENKPASADNKKFDAPLVGCYKYEKATQGEYIKIEELNGKYQINALPNPDNEGRDIKYLMHSGSADILKAIAVFKSSEDVKKKLSEMADFVLLGENPEKTNIVVFQVKPSLVKEVGHEYLFIIAGEPMGVIKYDCPK